MSTLPVRVFAQLTTHEDIGAAYAARCAERNLRPAPLSVEAVPALLGQLSLDTEPGTLTSVLRERVVALPVEGLFCSELGLEPGRRVATLDCQFFLRGKNGHDTSNESLVIEDKYVRVGAIALDYLRKLENGQGVNCEVLIEGNAVNVYTTREVMYMEQLVCALLPVYRPRELAVVVSETPTKDMKNYQKFATLVGAHRPLLVTHKFYLDRFPQLQEYYPRLAEWQQVWVADELVRSGGVMPPELPQLLGKVVGFMEQYDSTNKNKSPLRMRPWVVQLDDEETLSYLQDRVPAEYKNEFANVSTLPEMRATLEEVGDALRDGAGDDDGRSRLLSDLMRLYACTHAFYECNTDFINCGALPEMLGFKSRPAMSPGMVGTLRLPLMDVAGMQDAVADQVRSELQRVLMGEIKYVKHARMGSGKCIVGSPAIDVALGLATAEAIVAKLCPI